MSLIYINRNAVAKIADTLTPQRLAFIGKW